MSRGFVLPSQISPPIAAAGGLVVVKAETAFTTVGSVTADDVFTSSYTNYRIVITASGGTDTGATFQFRVGGAAAGSNYNRQYLQADSTTVSAGRTTAQASFPYSAARNVAVTEIIELFGPQLAAATNISIIGIQNGVDATTPRVTVITGNHSTATAYDGIALTFGSNMSGRYTIYGYGKTV